MFLRFAAALIVVAVATSGCGSERSSSTPTPPNPPQPPGSPPEVFTAADGTRFSVEVVTTNVEIPWGLAFAPDGRLFFSERPGRVRVIQSGRLLADPALTLTDVFTQGEAGLLGLTLHPDFANNHLVYLVYTARLEGGGAVNRVMRYREVANTLAEQVTLVDNIPGAVIHDGARIRFGPDGMLYVSMGDANMVSLAQNLGSLSGKILRMHEDGTSPGDNPFASLVYSLGHRNPQGLDWHPQTGDLWETEHGPTGNDEVNLIERGRNYGWPVIQGTQVAPGLEQPILLFGSAIAPSGASFYRGNAIPNFRNNLFFATLAGAHLRRVRLDPANPRRVIDDERLLQGRFGRLRDVISGPDGFLYFCTSNRDGRGAPVPEDDRILRIVPAR